MSCAEACCQGQITQQHPAYKTQDPASFPLIVYLVTILHCCSSTHNLQYKSRFLTQSIQVSTHKSPEAIEISGCQGSQNILSRKDKDYQVQLLTPLDNPKETSAAPHASCPLDSSPSVSRNRAGTSCSCSSTWDLHPSLSHDGLAARPSPAAGCLLEEVLSLAALLSWPDTTAKGIGLVTSSFLKIAGRWTLPLPPQPDIGTAGHPAPLPQGHLPPGSPSFQHCDRFLHPPRCPTRGLHRPQVPADVLARRSVPGSRR